jgi:hypothetical protein
MRSSLPSVVAATFALCASGCFLKLNESPVRDTGMEAAGLETPCLDGAAAKFARYLDGAGNGAEIAALCDCADLSIRKFVEHTRGGRPGEYSFDELRSFLRRYFLKDVEISDRLLREAAELKRVGVGGSAGRLTLDELNRTRDLIAAVKAELIRLAPYMPLTRAHAAEMAGSELHTAIGALLDAAANVGRRLDPVGEDYPFERLEGLVTELQPHWNGDGPATLLRRLPLARELKVALLFTPRDRIRGGEWTELLVTVAQWYGLALQYAQLDARHPEWTHGEGRAALLRLAAKGRELIEQAVQRNPGNVIRFAQLNRVIRALEADDLPVQRETLVRFLAPAFRGFLGGSEGGPEGRDAIGLTGGAVARAWTAIQRWSEGQRYLEGTFRRIMSESYRVIPRGLKEQSFSPAELLRVPVDEALRATGAATRFGTGAAEELRRVIKHQRPFFRGADMEAFFPGPLGDSRHSFHNLSEANWMRGLARVLITGYAEEPARARAASGVTLQELHRFIEDIRPVMVELKCLDPRRKPEEDDLHTKRFLEANLFTYSGNGDGYFDLDEGAELVAFMVSSKRLALRTHRELEKVCQTGALDPFGYPVIEPRCFRRELFAGFERYWDHLPGMARYFGRLTPGERAELGRLLEESARRKGYTMDWFESADTEGLSLIVMYIEALYTRFDRDGSGALDVDEAREAFRIFRGTLADRTGSNDRDWLWGLFTYLLKNGTPPERNLGGGLGFWWWRQREPIWSLEADRAMILRIFSEIGKLSQGAAR